MTTPQIQNLTGTVRSDSSAILVFIGPPDKSIEWVIVSGAGLLFPLRTYTDEYGQATCRFDADGWSGPVVIGVQYVP